MSDDYGYRLAFLEGRVNAHFMMIMDTEREVEKLRGTIKEERSPSCQCSSSSSPSPGSLSSDSLQSAIDEIRAIGEEDQRIEQKANVDALRRGVRNCLSLSRDAGFWLSREEILALLGEQA